MAQAQKRELELRWEEYYRLRERIDPQLKKYPDALKDYIARRLAWLNTDYDKLQILNEIIDGLDPALSLGENQRIVDSVIARFVGREFSGHVEEWDVEKVALDLTYCKDPEIIRDFLSQYGAELREVNPSLYLELAEYAGLVAGGEPEISQPREPEPSLTPEPEPKPEPSQEPGPSLTPEPRAELTVGPGIAQAPASEPLEPSAADWGAEKVDVEIEVDIPTEGDFGAEWGEPELRALEEVLRSGFWGGGVGGSGPWERELEERFARMHGCKFGVAVSSGTAALHVAYLAAGVGPGDEVIAPALTFSATGAAALMAGATVVVVDVDPETLCMDVGEAERAVTERTKVITAVYNYGSSPDMDGLRELADERGLHLIEDCARAHGFQWGGRPAGSIGEMGCFSFQQSKFLTAGEGGMVTTNSEELAEKCHALKDCGRVRGRAYLEGGRYWLNWFNYRMTQFQAALLLAQLGRFEGQLRRRQENSEYLTRRLSEVDGVEPVRAPEKLTRRQPWPYAFKYDPRAFGGASVDRFVEALRAEGIPASRIDHPPLYETLARGPWGRVVRRGRCRAAREAVERVVTLPQHVFLADRRDMDDIVEAVLKVQRHSDEL